MATFNFMSSCLFSKNRHSGKLNCAFVLFLFFCFFTTKVSSLISVKGGKDLSRSHYDKIPNISVKTCLIICFHHFDILSLKLVVE